jgi:hypothetical protein
LVKAERILPAMAMNKMILIPRIQDFFVVSVEGMLNSYVKAKLVII